MNSFCDVLIALLVLFLLFVPVELAFVLLYRRRFHRASTAAALSVLGGDVENATPSVSSRTSSTYTATPPPSKELVLYYLLFPQDSRPLNQTPTNAASVSPVTAAAVFLRPIRAPLAPAAADSEIESAKFRAAYGTRLLNSIKEGEKEGAELEKGSGRARVTAGDLCPSPPTPPQPTSPPMEDDEEEVFGTRATPFDTPCSSPFFYTPVSSPTREGTGGGSGARPMEV